MAFEDITPEELNEVTKKAFEAFTVFRQTPRRQRSALLHGIADEIERLGDNLLETALGETALPIPRLRNERARTVFQLRSYGDACAKGDWLEARIDRNTNKENPAPDLRKMRIPMGPVAVFGAANFPFAYSTAGGDTASALAAGCPVIVKAHPAHAATSEMIAGAIAKAVAAQLLPSAVFSHVHGVSFEVGKQLVTDPKIKAVGFTGSLAGGRQLFDWACQRPEPIPVFAEMSSINPVFILPGKMEASAGELAKTLAGSITLGVGQFCTNPGLIIALDNDALKNFTSILEEEIRKVAPGTMLHAGIFKNYVEKRANALSQEAVDTLVVSEGEPQFNQAVSTVAMVTAETFLANPILHQEVFGPYSLVVKCRTLEEMREMARRLEGQLTASILSTAEEISHATELVDELLQRCGRCIFNGVPTGVEVTAAMHHGGPYPATTDARFTSVGEDALKRFSRPVAFQNWPEELLPDELKDANPLKIGRWENGRYRGVDF
jgi:NADP-dependent aldehyde dehydrogenase